MHALMFDLPRAFFFEPVLMSISVQRTCHRSLSTCFSLRFKNGLLCQLVVKIMRVGDIVTILNCMTGVGCTCTGKPKCSHTLRSGASLGSLRNASILYDPHLVYVQTALPIRVDFVCREKCGKVALAHACGNIQIYANTALLVQGCT